MKTRQVTLEHYAALALRWRRLGHWYGLMAIRMQVRAVYGRAGLVTLDFILLRGE